MDPALNLPPEVWTRIFLFACTVPDAFNAHPHRTRTVLQSEAREDWWRLQNDVASCRYTYRCIALVCRSWYHFSIPFFWNHLILHSIPTVIGAAHALNGSRSWALQHPYYAKSNNNFLQNGDLNSSRAPPNGGMGWFVRRIDLEIELPNPTMAENETLLRALASILSMCPNLHIFADHAHPGPSFDDTYVLYLPDGLLSYLFRPNNNLRRVDWSANNLIPFCSHLHSAPHLRVLNLHYFTGNPLTWLGSTAGPAGVSLPFLDTLVLNEDPECLQAEIVSTWHLPNLQTLRLEVSPDFGSDQFLRTHGHNITTLSLHTPISPRPFYSIAHYCSYTPNLESLFFQLHHPPFALFQPQTNPLSQTQALSSLKMIGIQGLLSFRGRSFDDGEEEQLHRHLTAMVRSRARMPQLKVIRLVDFDPESWKSEQRTAREVARWQRWQLRWEMLGVRWEDRDGMLMRVPDKLLELLEQRDLDDDDIYSDEEMAVDEELEGFSDYLSMSSTSGMWD
ncbi:hypothetical protein FRC14_004965 [Serendipita sp. 396]|nr:hypothetical protein FRC14_004965 [Serendipita sp. 396]KAG8787142.1 hypothetical protein FRC15_009887 [Serendipita sp. 397]KAG8860770.1 hypothetical protein FRB91_001034 [Serendipita sp. 411]